jgi:CzcA family heavy metal efflux pump
MLNWLVGFSLRNRFVVLTLAGVLLVGGLYVVLDSPLDVFPEFAPPQVTVETEAPGLSAEEVEALVTARLELAINGSPGLERLRSLSLPGVSSLTAFFRDGTDIYRDRQLVAERIATVGRDLPASVVPPEIAPLVSASSTIEIVALAPAGAGYDPLAARTFADWTLEPRILAVPGIAKVVTYGGAIAEAQVVVLPSALRDHSLSLREIEDAARGATALGPAGAVEANGQRFPIRALAQATRPEDLGNAVVAFRDGRPLLLSQVATIGVGAQFPIGDAILGEAPAVVLLISRQPDVNTLRVTAELDAALDDVAHHLPAGLRLERNLFRQATFIDVALRNLRRSLAIGGILVALVLFAFLLDLRTALISLAAIPLSLLAALVVLRACGATVNTMTLGGLVIALGEVVDDSIIDVENVLRRLRENRARPDPLPAHQVILQACLEVRSAVVYATFLVALVFLPVFFLSGVAGKIFSPLAQAYVLATLASLGVALLVTPAAASLLLTGRAAERGDGALARWLKRRYAAVLPRSLRHPGLLLAGGISIALLAGATLPSLAGEFFPAFEEPDFTVHMTGLPGTSLAAAVEAGKRVARELLAIPGVLTVDQRAGRAELADEVFGPEASEIDVSLAPGTDTVETTRLIRERLAPFPGFVFGVSQFFGERLEETAGGEPAPVSVIVSGPDLKILRELGAQVGAAMQSIPDAVDVRIEPQLLVPQIEIAFDRALAARVGATLQDLQSAVTTAFGGSRVAQLFDGQRVVPVVVKFPDESRADLEAIRALPIRTPGGVVSLGTLARVEIRDAPNLISREGGVRRLVVSCDSEGSIGQFSRALEARLESLPLPPGYGLRFSGDYENAQRSLRELLLVGAAAMLGILLLLYADFRSLRLAALVLGNLPLALVGGMAAAFIFRITLSLGAVVGFVTLFGITARNAIMLVAHFRHLEESEGMPFGPDLVVRGALDRVLPIVMTALVTGLALVPLIVGGSRAGQEIEHPMAVIIAGGLASSTALTLLLLPSFYLRWGKPATQRPAPGAPG